MSAGVPLDSWVAVLKIKAALYQMLRIVSKRNSLSNKISMKCLSDILVSQAQSFFRGNIGHKKRQTSGGRAPTFEELTFTVEQRAFCNNERTCLYDLAVTGVREVAATTLQTSEESDRVQSLIGKIITNSLKCGYLECHTLW